MDKVRSFWNGLFRACTLPQEIKDELRNRFRSRNDAHHSGALFELYVFSFLTSRGFVVDKATSRHGKNPDFAVQCQDKSEFVLEVTCVIGDEQPANEDRFMNMIQESLNNVPSSQFRVVLSIKGEFSAEQSVKPLIRSFEHWLRRLEQRADTLTHEMLSDEDTHFQSNISGLDVVATAIHVPRLGWTEKSQLVCASVLGNSIAVRVDEFILKKLKKKKTQLKLSRLPKVIALNIFEPFLDDNDILDALFGRVAVETSFGSTSTRANRRVRGKGFWLSNGRPANRDVCAIMVFHAISAASDLEVRPQLILNPFALAELQSQAFEAFDCRVPSSDFDEFLRAGS